MQYHPSSITAAKTDSLAALLHRAADIVATDAASVDAIAEAATALGYSNDAASNARPVSYTHLTLPTKRIV